MPAIGPHSPTPSNEPVDAPRDANGEPTHPARQRLLGACFNEQMDMVRLYRELGDSKLVPLLPIGIGDGQSNRREYELGAQWPECRAHGDVNRVHRCVLGPSSMQRLGAYSGLSAGTFAQTAPAIGNAKPKLSAAPRDHD